MKNYSDRSTYIFDMDGVLVDSATYHYQSWCGIAERLGVDFTPEHNENLKGISRAESLDYILSLKPSLELTTHEKTALLVEKNEIYLESIKTMDQHSLLPGIAEVLTILKDEGKRLAIGSSSKNARYIARLTSLDRWMEVISDGTDIQRSKPDPQVFLIAAERLGVQPTDCVVIEDSASGVSAANSVHMLSVGIGSAEHLSHADHLVADTQGLAQFIKQLYS